MFFFKLVLGMTQAVVQGQEFKKILKINTENIQH